MSKKKVKPNPRQGKTLAELKAILLASGKITEEGLAEARRELHADPEFQLFLLNNSTHKLG